MLVGGSQLQLQEPDRLLWPSHSHVEHTETQTQNNKEIKEGAGVQCYGGD